MSAFTLALAFAPRVAALVRGLAFLTGAFAGGTVASMEGVGGELDFDLAGVFVEVDLAAVGFVLVDELDFVLVPVAAMGLPALVVAVAATSLPALVTVFTGALVFTVAVLAVASVGTFAAARTFVDVAFFGTALATLRVGFALALVDAFGFGLTTRPLASAAFVRLGDWSLFGEAIVPLRLSTYTLAG